MIFTSKFKPGLCDAGSGGEIKNRSILRMLEDTAGFHSDSISDGINDMDTKKTAWVIMAWRLHVIQRPHYGSELTVETWSRSMERAHAYRDFRLKSPDGSLLAVASSKWSLINMESRRLLRIPAQLSDAYGTEPVSVFEHWSPKRPEFSGSFVSQMNYRVMRRDTDIIGHMHNLNYLELACELIPENIYTSGEFADTEIIYRSEIRLGDDITLYCSPEGGQYTVYLTGKSGLCATVRMW